MNFLGKREENFPFEQFRLFITIFREQEILRDEIRSSQSMRNRLRLRVDELEGEKARIAAKSEQEVVNN